MNQWINFRYESRYSSGFCFLPMLYFAILTFGWGFGWKEDCRKDTGTFYHIVNETKSWIKICFSQCLWSLGNFQWHLSSLTWPDASCPTRSTTCRFISGCFPCALVCVCVLLRDGSSDFLALRTWLAWHNRQSRCLGSAQGIAEFTTRLKWNVI